jgi:plasmid stabilization system protein ParE
MALEIQWSRRADKKFDKILEYLLVEWSERVTQVERRKAKVKSKEPKEFL